MARILIVDDDDRPRTAARAVLEEESFEVQEASDGRDAVRLFREHPADLILCDMFMPGKDGLETIRELRKEFPGVRIIAISGGGYLGGLDVLQMARRLGAAEVLHKPFHRAPLLEAVRRVLAAD